MRIARWLTAIMLLLFLTVAHAGDNPLLVTWKLNSVVRKVLATGERLNQLGEHPNGYLSYSSDGRMYAIVSAENRVKPREFAPTDEERIMLHRTFQAYAGTYTLEPGKVVHHVDISWNESFTGTDQVRFYNLAGSTLTIKTAPAKSAIDGREGVTLLVWEKVEGANDCYGRGRRRNA